MKINTLIDKRDNAEIIRDQIAAILAVESAHQVALAAEAGKPDPDAWRLRVFQERSNPWENLPGPDGETSPVVNVWWDSSTFDTSASNVVERQKSDGTYYVDCYAYGQSSPTAEGHVAGDKAAAEAVQRAVRLCRNILMAGPYTYLGLRGVVWRRWVNSISIFQPQQDGQNVHHIVGARLSFGVEFNELAPQVQPEALDLLTVGIHRADTGELIVEASYDYTA